MYSCVLGHHRDGWNHLLKATGLHDPIYGSWEYHSMPDHPLNLLYIP